MCMDLCTDFQVSSIILVSFRQEVILPTQPPPQKKTPKNPTQIRVKN